MKTNFYEKKKEISLALYRNAFDNFEMTSKEGAIALAMENACETIQAWYDLGEINDEEKEKLLKTVLSIISQFVHFCEER